MLQTVLPPGAKLGINIAPGHLHAESFKDDMRTFKSLLPPDYFQIVLEITERDMLNHREASSLFEWLHNEGFEIAIDDFGTGHSALIYLEHFTMDYLKIDRGFVNAIGTETVTSGAGCCADAGKKAEYVNRCGRGGNAGTGCLAA